MARKKLDGFPPEVRERLDLPDGLDERAGFAFMGKSVAAYNALLRHYGIDPKRPALGRTKMEELFHALAGDFLPAWRWARRPETRRRGRRKSVNTDALRALFKARQEMPQHSDARACAIIATRWKTHPKENPFGRQLTAATLRKYLPRAKYETYLPLAKALMAARDVTQGDGSAPEAAIPSDAKMWHSFFPPLPAKK